MMNTEARMDIAVRSIAALATVALLAPTLFAFSHMHGIHIVMPLLSIASALVAITGINLLQMLRDLLSDALSYDAPGEARRT